MLGLIQGLTEPLPVSSQGVVTVVNAWLFDATLADAASFSLWLHLGTALSVIFAFRQDVTAVLRDAVSRPTKPTPSVSFLIIATVVSAPPRTPRAGRAVRVLRPDRHGGHGICRYHDARHGFAPAAETVRRNTHPRGRHLAGRSGDRSRTGIRCAARSEPVRAYSIHAALAKGRPVRDTGPELPAQRPGQLGSRASTER